MGIEKVVFGQSTENITLPVTKRYYINSNGVDKTPSQDTVEFSRKKKNNAKRNILMAIGIAVVAGLALIFTKGKGNKNIGEVVKDSSKHIKPHNIPTDDTAKITKEVEKKVVKDAEEKAVRVDDKSVKKTEEKIVEKTGKNTTEEFEAPQITDDKTLLEDLKTRIKRSPTNHKPKNADYQIVELTGHDGKIKKFLLEKGYNIDDGPFGKRKEFHYQIFDDEGKRICDWSGFLNYKEGASSQILKGNAIQTFNYSKCKGIGTKMKQIIKQAAKENGCSEISIEAAYHSHMFHNKMGYKVDFSEESSKHMKEVLGLIKDKSPFPEFNERISNVINSGNVQDGNTLMDEIFTLANTKKMRSPDIGIAGECIPMHYVL